MATSPEGGAPVKAKAVLVDPGTMRVVWLNEAVAAGLGIEPGVPAAEVPLEAVVPAEGERPPRALLADVASTGRPRHLRADMLANRLGAVAMLTSIYPLPDGMLLVVTESSFLTAPREGSAVRRSAGRRAR